MGVVFDLDDTLILESDYVRSGFRAVAARCAALSGLGAPEVFDFLWMEFLRGVRGDAFNRLLAAFPVLCDARIEVAELVAAYRGHTPAIALPPPMRELLLQLLRNGHRLGLISDGPLEAQAGKARALGLEEFFSPLLLTDQWGREFWKPHERAFLQIEQTWNEKGETLWYIGDNPHKDFIAPNTLGWRTVRLWQPGQQHFSALSMEPAKNPAQTVCSWAELSCLLRTQLRLS